MSLHHALLRRLSLWRCFLVVSMAADYLTMKRNEYRRLASPLPE